MVKKKPKVKKPIVVDLFCGCGGIALGFRQAGFSVLAGADNWKTTMETFRHNFPKAKAYCEDLGGISPEKLKLMRDLGLRKGQLDVLVGGPPCQGFSLAGNRNVRDPRNTLVFAFIRWVDSFKPKAFLMENVLGILSLNGGKVKDMILKAFRDIGYRVDVRALYAHHYGVPQKRRRAFFLGNRLGKSVRYPSATHGEGLLFKPFVTVGEAISDLPPLEEEKGEEKIPYPGPHLSDYQREMRERSRWIFNHVASNHTELTKKVIAFVPEGGNWKDVPKKYQNLRSFSNTWRRFDSKEPSVTIDTGHRHHFHYRYNRVPTVRESARIQSFPDRFRFFGAKTHQFVQVGNAVPPLLARALAKELIKTLNLK